MKKATPRPLEPNNPHLADVIEQNIRTIVELRTQAAANRSFQDRLADTITEFSGRMSFLYFHALWFAVWIGLNLGAFGLKAFDPFPFGLLTMIVSLEAIFLATFVLISQNRMAVEADHRADLDLQINLLTEHEITKVIKMLDAIQNKLGIANDTDTELPELEREVRAEDVLTEMNLAQRRAKNPKVIRGDD